MKLLLTLLLFLALPAWAVGPPSPPWIVDWPPPPPPQPIATITKAELQTTNGIWTVPDIGEFEFIWHQLPTGTEIELWEHDEPVNPLDDTTLVGTSYVLKLPPFVDRVRATFLDGDFIAQDVDRHGWQHEIWRNGEMMFLGSLLIPEWTEWSMTPIFGGSCTYPVNGGEIIWIHSFTELCDEQTPPPGVAIAQQAMQQYINAFAHCDKPELFRTLMVRTSDVPEATSNGRISLISRDWYVAQPTQEKRAALWHELHHDHQGHLMDPDYIRSYLIESLAVLAEGLVDPDNTSWISRYSNHWSDRMPARGLRNTIRESFYTPAAFLWHIKQNKPDFNICQFYEQEGNHIRNTQTLTALQDYVGVNELRDMFEAWQHNYHVYRDSNHTPYANLIPSGPATAVNLEQGYSPTIGQTVTWTNPSPRALCLATLGNPALPFDTTITVMKNMADGVRTHLDATYEGIVPLYGDTPEWWLTDPGQYSFAVTSVQGVGLTDDQPTVDLQVIPCQ